MKKLNITVTKKDGTTEAFDTQKIVVAISKSADRIGRVLTKKDYDSIVNALIQNLSQSVVHVTDLHKMVVSVLRSSYPDVAKSYQDYRDYKLTYAKDFDTLFQETKDVLYLGDRENANFDSALISTKGSLIRGYLTKKLYQRFYLTKKEAEMTRRGDFYLHDLRDLILGSVNCLDENTWITIREHGDVKTLTLGDLRERFGVEEGIFALSKGIQILSKNGWVDLQGISIRRLEKNEAVYNIKTKNGLGIKATANHQIPVITKEGQEELKFVKDIVVGDSLISSPNNMWNEIDSFIDLCLYVEPDKTFVNNIKYLKRYIEYKYDQPIQKFCRQHGIDIERSARSITIREFLKLRNLIDIPFEVYNKLSIGRKGSHIKSPLILPVSEDLARMFGCIFADGYVKRNDGKNGTTPCVIFCNTNQKMIADYAERAERVFPEHNIIIGHPSERSTTPCSFVRIFDYVVWSLFSAFKQHADKISIPDFIMNGSERIKYAFLSGAMDCDGTLGETQFVYTTVSSRFAEQLVLLMQSLGYSPTISHEATKSSEYTTKEVTGLRNYDTFKIRLSKIDELSRFIENTNDVRIKDVTLTERKSLIGNPSKIVRIIEEYPENVFVYDLQTGDHHFIANGVVVHNCCLFDIETVMKGGFEMANVKYTEPKSVLSALQVIGDVTLSATGQQFGGFTLAEIDRVLLPYCKKTLETARKEFDEWFGDGTSAEKREAFAMKKLRRELEQGFQSLELKLNTVCSSRGDFGFTTLTFGAMPEGATEEEKDIQRLVASTILKTRNEGHGPDHIAVVFPKLVYLYSKEQHKDPKQQALFKEALDCSSECMYPDYLAIDSEYGTVSRIYKEQGVITSPMGCRAYLSPWKDPKTGRYVTIGRCNIGAVSLNLVLLWELAKYEHPEAVEETFFNILDDRMELVRQFLRKRYETIENMPCSSNPLAFTQGGFYHGTKHPDEKVGDLTEYMTASFGYVGLHEVTEEARGIGLYEDHGKFAQKILKRMNDNIARFKEEDHRLYALYGTPAESYATTASTQVRKYLDSIGEHERAVKVPEYYTNSFHCHVSENITPFEKQDAEFECFHLSEGGHIQYVRIDDPTNLDGMRAIVERGMEMGFYQGVNFNSMYCQDCHQHSVPKGNNILECPLCHSHNTVTISRVCGYLGYSNIGGNTRMNEGKMSEISDRRSM